MAEEKTEEKAPEDKPAVKKPVKKEDHTLMYILIIIAVLALIAIPVILGIMTGVFSNVWDMTIDIKCAGSPINELATTIQKAQNGIITSTMDLCMSEREGLSSSSLTDIIANVDSLTFSCDSEVCRGTNPPLSVSPNSITAHSAVKFRGLVSCDPSAGNEYDCTIKIIDT